MKTMICLLFLVAGSVASPVFQAFSLQNDGSYKFAYDTSKETGSHSRSEEKGPDGVVIGKFSYEDPTGDLRVVNYQAGDFGYMAKGAVGVAGAPDSQFPVEQEITSEEVKDNQKEDGKIDESKTEETKSDVSPSDNEDDDAKAMKLQIPSEDGVPEGFPPGFFDQGFHGLRRLPEPTKEESEEGKKDNENGEESSSDKEDDKTNGTKHHSPLEYLPSLLPFSNFHPQPWSGPFYYSSSSQLAPFHHSASFQPSPVYQHSANSQQHPVYVYSYQAPKSHGYYYYY